MCGLLGWPDIAPVIRAHAKGASLAIAAPTDQLFTATEVNEWAWEAAVLAHDGGLSLAGFDRLHPYAGDFPAAAAVMREKSAQEHRPALLALLAAARQRALPVLIDDDTISIGAGAGSWSWPLLDLPTPESVPWAGLHDIPKVLVSGSNGKTTTVRLICAMLDAVGRASGHCCTDGVFVGGGALARGDYSGPAGARLVLRDRGVGAAVLETARGGILRRGLAVDDADVAVVTNVSADHFGEYGIDTLADLADTKLVLARALNRTGVLVLNADDGILMSRATGIPCKRALFARDHSHPALAALRGADGSTCGTGGGRLLLHHAGSTHDLGSVADMPVTAGGNAVYNIANAAAAALAARALDIPLDRIAGTLARFGSSRHDNPGRLETWHLNGVTVITDYAHNPDGLGHVLAVARAACSTGRLGLLLGQAGNRSDEAMRELAGVAAGFKPDIIILKEIASMLRGRAPGETPRILHAELAVRGIEDSRIRHHLDEIDAVRTLLAWARPGDVLVLPVHDPQAKAIVARGLDLAQHANWHPGNPLPIWS